MGQGTLYIVMNVLMIYSIYLILNLININQALYVILFIAQKEYISIF